MSSRNLWMPYGFFMLRSLRSSFPVKPSVEPELSVAIVCGSAIFVMKKCSSGTARHVFGVLRGSRFGRLTGKKASELPCRIDQQVRNLLLQGVWSESVGDADGPQPCIATGAHIDVRVSDDHSVFRPNATLLQQFARAFRFGFLGRKTIAAVYLREELSQPERVDDSPRRNDRLVCKHRHLARIPVRGIPNRRQHLRNSRVDGGVIEFVLPVVRKKEFQALAHQRLVACLGAECPLNQDGSAITHIAGDDVIRQLRPFNVAQRCVDGVYEVQTRINEGAVQVKDHQLDRVRVKGATGSNHQYSG